MEDDPEITQEIPILWLGLIVEGGMLLLALALSWLGLFAADQPLHDLTSATCWDGLTQGILWTIPMLVLIPVLHFWTPNWLQPLKEFVDEKLIPMFQESSVFELGLLSLMAGFGEEILFRWCLQGGIASGLESSIGPQNSMMLGLVVASVLFGVCHWVNSAYGILTTLIGLYLGWLMLFSGTWLVPAVAHSLYDFVALLFFQRLGASAFVEKNSGDVSNPTNSE